MANTDRPDTAEPDVELSDHGTTGPSPRRRRLVKGAAALAPAVFTLHSGAARAMNSAAAMCAQHTQQALSQALDPPPLHLAPKRAAKEDPRFARLHNMDGIVARGEGKAQGKTVRLLEYPNGFFDPDGVEYERVEKGSKVKYHPVSDDQMVYVEKKDDRMRHELACFTVDDQGGMQAMRANPDGFSMCPTGTNALAHSCWSSMT